MSKRLLAGGVSALLLLGATGSSFASQGTAKQSQLRPPISRAIHSTLNFGIYFMPEVPVSKLEWELELEYEIDDVRGVYDHYDQALRRLGFSRTSYEADDDEIEASYSWAGIKASLEVESDDGKTEVELELEGHASANDGRAFRFDEFGGINIPFFHAAITAIEWEVDFRHTTRDYESVYRYYDEGLTWQGWTRTDVKFSGDKIKSKYVNGDQEIKLEVKGKRDYVSVEFELE